MSTWQSFVKTSETAVEPVEATPETGLQIAPLTTYQQLLVTGQDATTFLQGQCTCDFRRLDSNQWLLGAHCNPKGRMISSFKAARQPENRVALVTPADNAEIAESALNKYIVFSKAEIIRQPLKALGLIFSESALPPLKPGWANYLHRAEVHI